MSRFGAFSLILFALFTVAVRAEDATSYRPAIYEKGDTLQQTLLETRRHYARWLSEQPAARQAVEFSPWRATPMLPAEMLDGLIHPEAAIDPAATLPDGRPLWTPREDLADGKPVALGAGGTEQAVYLTRTIRAEKPVRLTVGLGAGDRLDVWLNGRKIASACTHLVSGRYGCSYQTDGTRVDQLLVDLDLQAGENTLTVRVTPGEDGAFYCSASPDPVPRFWEQLRRDFPIDVNPLLEAVHADWFATTGWFAAADTRFEQQLIERLAAECERFGPAMLAEWEQLQKAQTDPNNPAWLDLCVKGATAARLQGNLDRLRAATGELAGTYPDEYPGAELLAVLDDYQQRLEKQWAERLDPAGEATRALMAEMPLMQRRMLVEENPLLRNAELLFVRRFTYDSKHYYDDFQHVFHWGGNLCVLSLSDGRVRELAPELSGGVFDRYDLSFDARKVVFGYRRPKPEGFRLWEVNIDGTGLRQITQPPADEAERIAAYGKTSTGDGFYGSMGYRFWTDDVHPCYLPDGGICFASTRSEHGVLCTPDHYLACTNLFRIDAGGGGLRPLSRGALSEFTPTLLEDGRILYNRWEYVYKGVAVAQPLWTMRPDGSIGEEFYGDNIANPGVFWQARQVPGRPNLAVCIGCGHEPMGVGQVLLLDVNKEKRTTAPMKSLTPQVRTQGLRGLYQLRNGVWREDIYGPFYADPFPLSDKFFLVACNPDRRYNDQTAYGIYLLDAFGNRVLIHRDPEMSCWEPMPLRPRQKPPVLPEVSAPSQLVAETPAENEPTATIFLSDVYRGLPGVEPGAVKYLRVMEQIPKPWSAEVDPLRGEDRNADGFGGHLVVSHNAHIWVAVLRGVVPVEPDGSACFEVPAGRNLFFQALDENFMEIQRMRTFINLEPGETRSCIGCHEQRRQAPVSRLTSALAGGPVRLSAQPGETAPRPLYYPTDVQPIWDRHCTGCHDGAADHPTPDLRDEMTTLFNRSYENIFQAGLVDTIQEWNGMEPAMANAEAVPPYSHGSHRSRLVELLRKGHHDVELSREEWIRMVTWIDCGAPYYGSYFGRRNLAYRGQPDFRPVPTLASARGTAPVYPELEPPEPLPARLLAWWPLDKSSASSETEPDAAGQGHSLKRVNATSTEGRDGRGARLLDGRGYLQSEGLGVHEAVSIALWVKADSLGHQWNPLLFRNDGLPGAVHFSLLPDGVPNVAINTGGSNWTHRRGNTACAVGQWHHVALVCDGRPGGSARFYVDGEPVGGGRLFLGLPLDLNAFRLGMWNGWENDPANNFHGEMADVRVYSGMLNDEEVARLAVGTPEK